MLTLENIVAGYGESQVLNGISLGTWRFPPVVASSSGPGSF